MDSSRCPIDFDVRLQDLLQVESRDPVTLHRYLMEGQKYPPKPGIPGWISRSVYGRTRQGAHTNTPRRAASD